MQPVDFKTSSYFSGSVTILGYLLVGVALALLFVNVTGGLLSLFIGIVIFSTHYRLRIDPTSKAYHDYLWILGFKHGERGTFERIEYLFIKKSIHTQTMQLRVASTTIRKEVFDAYLKFSEREKVHLLTMDSKEQLLARLAPVAAQLKTQVIDYSE
jgi:hypothetical protein